MKADGSSQSRPRIDLKPLARFVRRVSYCTRIAPWPFRVHLDVTDRCNSRCPTCSKWKTTDPGPELTADQWRPIFARFRGRVVSRRVVIGGGEPLVRPDILDIIADLKAAGLHVILITNGLRLDEETLDHLEAAGLDNLMVSLNSLRPEVHDATRGVPGGHRRIIDVLPALRDRRFTTTLASIVLRENLEELPGIVDLAERSDLAGVIFQVLVSQEVHHAFGAGQGPVIDDDWFERDPQWIRDGDALDRVVDRLIAMKRAGAPIANPTAQLRWFRTYYRRPRDVTRIPCLAGVTSMCIDPYGRVRLCYCFPPVGDLTAADPIAVWRSREARAVRRAMRRCTLTCRLQNHHF